MKKSNWLRVVLPSLVVVVFLVWIPITPQKAGAGSAPVTVTAASNHVPVSGKGGLSGIAPKGSAGLPPNQVPKKQSEPPYPAIPETPATLELAGQPNFREGDSWTYLVSSGDPQLDGMLLRVTLTKVANEELGLSLQPGGSGPFYITLAWAGNGWLCPIGAKDGTFSMRMFGVTERSGSSDKSRDAASSMTLPIKLEFGYQTNINIGGRWEQNFATGERKEWPGSTLGITGPEICVVPAKALACGRFAFVGADSRIVSYLAAEISVAVRAEFKPWSTSGWLLFELHSWEAAGTRQDPTFPDIPKAERQKALDWLRPKLAGMPENRSYDAVGSFLALLHSQLRAHPVALTQIFLTPGVTNDGKGHVAEWKKGKFSVREMTAAEIAAEPKESMKGTVVIKDDTQVSTPIGDVQKMLKELGYDPGPLDGQWGKKTEQAIKEFQKDAGLAVTGRIDGEAIKVLKSRWQKIGRLN